MSDDREPPEKRSKCSQSTPQNEEEIFEAISTTRLLDMNDDCLETIFGYLDLIELCPITQVCKRLQHLSSFYFNRKYNRFDLDFSTLFTHRLISNKEAGYILRSFAKLIESVTLPRLAFQSHDIRGHVEKGLLKDVVEYCGETLKNLKLKNFYFTLDSVELLNMLSKSLQHLSLVGSVLDTDCVFYLSSFSSLKTLEISDTRDCCALMDSYEALEKLRLQKVLISTQTLKHFILTHKQLKVFDITKCNGFSSDVVRFIGKYMKNLIKFVFDGNRLGFEMAQQIANNILHLSELKNLRIFLWNFKSMGNGNLLAKMVSNEIAINELLIGHNEVDDEMIETIGKMKTLKTLVFFQVKGLKDQHLIKIAEEAKQLKKFRIELMSELQENITLDVWKEVVSRANQLRRLRIYLEVVHLELALYNDILEIVKARNNGIKLTIKIKRQSTDVYVLIPKETIQRNKHWLMIE